MEDISQETLTQLETIFLPYATRTKKEFMEKNNKFVHYTSAENAINIIRNKTMWMRNAKCMNDYNEIRHGHEMLVSYFSVQENKDKFINTLDELDKDLAIRVFNNFDEWWNRIHLNTFIVSISEHPKEEDKYGRLSMWRAYGSQGAKAALILNIPHKNPNDTAGLRLFLTPVAYYTFDELKDNFSEIISNIQSNTIFLKSVPIHHIENTIFITLVMASVSLKHKGFCEEREWRIVYLPLLYSSDNLKSSVEVINGIPQTIYKIPLQNFTELNVKGISIPELIERVLIGPTEYPSSIFDAFSHTLTEAGIESAWERVEISDIPLR